jgi:P-type Cu+ transporter
MNCCQEKHKNPIDPVCGMEVDQPHPKLVAIYKQKKYYFCAEACLNDFQQQPDYYLCQPAPKAPKKKGIWGRYLDRLNKTTGGKAMNCH